MIALYLVLAAPLWPRSLAFAEPRCRLETPVQSLDALLASARQRNQPYVASSPAQLRKTLTAVNLLLDSLKRAQSLGQARAALAAAHLQLVATQLGGAAAVAVVEAPNHREGRGIFVWRCGALTA